MADIQDKQVNVQQEYQKRWGSLQGSARREWVQENFIRPSNIILKYWGILKQSIGKNAQCNVEMNAHELGLLASFLDESRRARSRFSSHFYQCNSGHTYSFTECIIIGGRKSCPECGIWVEDISQQQREGHVTRVPVPVPITTLAPIAKPTSRPSVGSTATSWVPGPSAITAFSDSEPSRSSPLAPNRPTGIDRKGLLRSNTTTPSSGPNREVLISAGHAQDVGSSSARGRGRGGGRGEKRK
ncbi:hypothetical protein RSAG8_13702, partial [Rhizoctonia solani AG-8 WAC10335]